MLGLSGLATHFHVLESMPHMARTEGSHGAAGHMDAYQRDLVHLSARPPPAAGPAAGVTAEDVELVPLEPIHEEEGDGEGGGGGEGEAAPGPPPARPKPKPKPAKPVGVKVNDRPLNLGNLGPKEQELVKQVVAKHAAAQGGDRAGGETAAGVKERLSAMMKQRQIGGGKDGGGEQQKGADKGPDKAGSLYAKAPQKKVEKVEEAEKGEEEAGAKGGAKDGDGYFRFDPSAGGNVLCPQGGCGLHGKCVRGRCLCAVLYEGAKCDKEKHLPTSSRLKDFRARFDGILTMNKKAMAGKRSINVFLPGKEKEPGGGHRNLGPVSRDLMRGLPPEDIFRGKVFESCAVVGSSGIVHHYENGAEIDKHEMVMRFNSAPTKKFEKFVGSKTTYRITNTQNWAFRESKREQILVHMRASASLRGLVRTYVGDPSVKMAAFHPDFVMYMASNFKFMPTSGLYGVMIALQHCARMDLYGFQVSFEHGTLYHYYDECDQPANKGRDGDEWYAVKTIVEGGLAHFAEPCIRECHQSKQKCIDCKQGAGFRAVTNYGAAKRRSCPRCSRQYGGCRPGEGGKRGHHWAFHRKWRPPPHARHDRGSKAPAPAPAA